MPAGTPTTNPADIKPIIDDIDLVFIDPLPKSYECPMCGQVLRYPVQFNECGHHVCSNCLPDVIRMGAKCPTDGVEIDRDKVYVNKQLQKTIQTLRVKCSFHQKGCGWQGILRDIPGHVPECEYITIACPNGCGVPFERRYKELHLSSKCEKRAVQCEYCDKDIKKDAVRDHMTACPKLPMECPNYCGVKTIPREMLRQHMDTDCTKTGSACPFVEFGCQHKGEKTTLQKHIREEPTRHLSILCDGVVDLKLLMQSLQLNVERMSNRMEDILLRTDCLEKLYGAQLLWKIENYTQKFNEAKAGTKTTIFSPPFLTGRHGYKMALSACLFGDGKARGKYMSVFLCICRGEFDALLQWPFAHKVTFTLMDQCQDPAARRNINYTIKPNTAKENRPFLSRPMAERNASFGAQTFCDLATLDKLDYVRDDVVFLKVHVDTEEMTRI